jgi:multiple sugar transport system substrate-binding protein
MSRIRRRWLLLGLSGAVALVLGACNGDPAALDPDGDDAAPDGEQVTLRYFMWDPEFSSTEQEMIDRFEEAHQNIRVEMEAVNTPDYWTRLSAMAAAGELPDVFFMSAGFAEEWRDDGLLMNIQQYVDESIDEADYFLDAAEDARDENGDLYAFPFAFVETVLFYNQTVFEENGVPEPAEGWTWDDFLAAAQATTDDSMFGHWFYGRYAQIESWVYQNDGRLLNEDKTRFEPDDNAIEALQFLYDLIHVHEVAPRPSEFEGVRQQDVFGIGQAAMWVDGAWNIENNRDIVAGAFEWALAPIPRGPQATEDTAYGWPDLMAISPDSAHADEAWAFIDFMTGPERTPEYIFAGKIPIYEPVARSEEFLEVDMPPANKGFLLDWAEHTGPTSYNKGWGEWRGYTGGQGLEGQLDAAFNGEITLEEAIENATEYANQVLERQYSE